MYNDFVRTFFQRLQRNLGVSSRRMSSSYTTTTSATGMPTIDMEYHTKKSSNVNSSSSSPTLNRSVKKQSHRSKSHAGILTPAERNMLKKPHSRSFSHNPSTTQFLNQSKEIAKSSPTEETFFKVEIERGKPVYFEGMEGNDPSEDELNESLDDSYDKEGLLDHGEPLLPSVPLMGPSSRTKLSSMTERLEEVKETPEREEIADQLSTTDNINKPCVKQNSEHNEQSDDTSQQQTDTEQPAIDSSSANTLEQNTIENKRKLSDSSRYPPLAQRNVNLNIAEVAPVPKSDSNNTNKKSETLVIPSSTVRRKSSRELHMEYEIAVSMDIAEMLNKVKDWDFPIFQLSERCNVLTQVCILFTYQLYLVLGMRI